MSPMRRRAHPDQITTTAFVPLPRIGSQALKEARKHAHPISSVYVFFFFRLAAASAPGGVRGVHD